jgi:hypothetical protein
MTQIRMILMGLALTLVTLASARPAEACGGGYVPLTDEERVTAVIQAQMSWLKQGEIDSVERSWVAVDRAEVERWAREAPQDLAVTAIDARVTVGRIAVARVTLRSGERSWDALYVLRKRGGAWLLVHGAGLIPEPTTTAARG